MSALSNPIFQDANLAREWLESHLWPEGPVCGYCGTVNNAGHISTRPGYYQCNSKECRKQFTVMVNTIFERSHIPLNKWLMAAFLICSSKKGMSAHQMHRMLGISYKSTWFMMHRIREAMADNSFPGPLGGQNKVVEGDESYIGGKAKNRAFREPAPKKAVFSLVERDGGVRTFHIPTVSAKTLGPVIEQQVHKATMLMTDESPTYPGITKRLEITHGTVNHSQNEYVRAHFWHTNSCENYFSILADMIKSRRLGGVGRPFLEAIEQTAPYKGGNDGLRAIHDLDLLDKHQALVPTIAVVSLPWPVEIKQGPQNFTTVIAKDGQRLIIVDRDLCQVPLGQRINGEFSIMFDDVGAFKHRDVVKQLDACIIGVTGVLDLFQSIAAQTVSLSSVGSS